MSNVYQLDLSQHTTDIEGNGQKVSKSRPKVKFRPIKKGDHLTQDDLFRVGKEYHDKKKYRDCSIWMEAALKVEGGLNIDIVSDYAAFCFTQDWV